MDTSFWTNLNSKILCETTKKQFYNQYLYKLVMDAPFGRVLHGHDDIDQLLKYKIETHRNHNYGGSWAFKMSNNIARASAEQLRIIRSIRDDYKDTIKIRVEDPWVQFYARTEEDLRVITSRFSDECKSRCLLYSSPKDEEHAKGLRSGNIFISKDNGFKYKIFIRDGMYPNEVKQQLLNYIDSLGDDVKLSEGSRAQLSGPLNYIWGNFFYVKDPKLVTFISLIHPSIIRKIHELKVLEQ